jgi:YHS domain-containing protein
MLKRMIGFAAIAVGVLGLAAAAGVAQPEKKDAKKAKPEDLAKAKKALQEVQDFVGLWNLEGTQKAGAKTEAWKEKVTWGWKFEGGDAWLTVDFGEGKGKYYQSGELRYDVAKKKYLLTLTPVGKDQPAQAFEGDYVRGALKLERKDPKTNDVYRVTLNTVSEGERLAVKFEKQDGGKGLFGKTFELNGPKDGLVSGGPKKPECIVSGGAASIQVSYNGKPYFVCCSGCRDEFNANPTKYVKGK